MKRLGGVESCIGRHTEGEGQKKVELEAMEKCHNAIHAAMLRWVCVCSALRPILIVRVLLRMEIGRRFVAAVVALACVPVAVLCGCLHEWLR